MTNPQYQQFASNGGMKMIYDARMGPQAIRHDGKVYVVYQSGEEDLLFHPHIIVYDESTRQWSQPVKLGENAKPNHHLAPIIWLDHDECIHVLFGCHFSPGVHLVSRTPRDITKWETAPDIADSISYPTIFVLPGKKLCLLHRVEGHLGFWVYRCSLDGGWTWDSPRTIIDFNDRPIDETDRWAGCYLAATPTNDRKGLHLGFCHWEERDNINPHYQFDIDLFSRYNLYYLRLNIESGQLTTIEGNSVDSPVNRREAEAAKILDTGHEIANFPTIIADDNDNPCMLAVISDDSPWQCSFHFIRWRDGQWLRIRFAETDNVWSGSYLKINDKGQLTAHLVQGHGKNEEIFYGGGDLHQWQSNDGGKTWNHIKCLNPLDRHLYNNPRPLIIWPEGSTDDHLMFYGWENNGQVLHPSKPLPNIGKGFIDI